MKTIHPGHLEHRFCIFECQILCIPFLAIMPPCTLVLAYCCTVLTCSCTLVFLFSCIFKLCNHFQFATLGLRGPNKVCHLVSFHLIAFENISSNKNMPIFIHKYKYKWNHLVSPASCHQARQPCTGRQLCLLSLSPGEKISIVVAPKHQILIF